MLGAGRWALGAVLFSALQTPSPCDACQESNHPPWLVVVSVWHWQAGRLAGWPRSGQTRLQARDMLDMTVLTDRYASRPPFCRHGWVTISQNSDLDCCLLLPSDPPSQPLPLLQHGPEAGGTMVHRYLPRQRGGVMAAKYTCSRPVPRHIKEAGTRPSETSENKGDT